MTPEQGQELFNEMLSLILNVYILGLTFGYGIKIFKNAFFKGDQESD
jgi:hypothetical protein